MGRFNQAKYLQVSNRILEQRRHHQLRQSCRRVVSSRRLAQHAVRAEIVDHRLEHRSRQACRRPERIKRDGSAVRSADERGKDLVVLRDAGRNQRQRLCSK